MFWFLVLKVFHFFSSQRRWCCSAQPPTKYYLNFVVVFQRSFILKVESTTSLFSLSLSFFFFFFSPLFFSYHLIKHPEEKGVVFVILVAVVTPSKCKGASFLCFLLSCLLLVCFLFNSFFLSPSLFWWWLCSVMAFSSNFLFLFLFFKIFFFS